MKKKFTLLVAALALLTMIVQPLKAVGQESYSVTYDVDAIEGMFASGSSYTSASGYWKVPASSGNSAIINIPITYQPDSDITITFLIATFGSGTNPSASNTTISAIGTETNSNWSGSGVSSYPSSSTYVNGVMTITKPDDPTTLGGLAVTMGVNTGVKIFRLKGITVEYTYTTGGGGGDLEDNDLALSPTSLELDMYNNPNTGTITYNTSSTGAITVSESDYVTASVSDNTITVTPIAVTPSEQTITVSQAADDTYAAGSVTFTVTVTNSAPTVTVTYYANGGEGDPIVVNPYQGSDYTVAANSFSYTDHSFTKWTTNQDGTGTEYLPGATIENIQEDIDLYAQWEVSTEMILSFPFTSNPGGWPTINSTTLTEYTYTLGDEDYTFALKNVKCNSGYLMLSYVAVMGLPAIDGYKLTKVVASNSSNCSTSTVVGISSSASEANYISGGETQTWSTTSSQYTYNLSSTVGNTVYYLYVTIKNAQLINLSLTYEQDGSVPAPTITITNNNELVYDATSGSFNFTVNNPVEGGETAVTEDVDWISDATISEGSVTFTTTTNPNSDPREGIVTLTYTYEGGDPVVKNVTITQAGNPSTIDQISSINSVGTFYRVQGTVVALNARGCVIGDGTGYINFYNGYTAPSVNVGDYVTASGNIASYGNIYQFSNYSPSTATIATAESSNYDGTPAITIIDAIPDTYSSGTHLSDYFQFDGTLTKSSGYYYVSVGEGQISIAYPSQAQQTTMDALENKTVRVKGYFAGINSSSYFTVMLESIVEVLDPEVVISGNEIENDAIALAYDDENAYTVTVTYNHMEKPAVGDALVGLYTDASCETTFTGGWFDADFAANSVTTIEYFAEANSTNASRTVYMRVETPNSASTDWVPCNVIAITQAAAPTQALYSYSVNGVEGESVNIYVGEEITLATGTDLDDDYTFAGWTTDPTDVTMRLTGNYTIAEEVTTFYAVYAHTTGASAARYVKVTSLEDIVAGEYIIVSDGYYLQNDEVTAKDGFPCDDKTVTIVNDEITNVTTDMLWAFTGTNTAMSIKNGNWVLYTISEGNGLRNMTNNYAGTWLFSENSTGFKMKYSTTNRYCGIYSSGGVNVNWRSYTATGNYVDNGILYLYKKQGGSAGTTNYYTRVYDANTQTIDNIPATSVVTVPSGAILTLTGANQGDAANLIIEDGGQLINNSANPVAATIKKSIIGHNSGAKDGDNEGYYLVSSPVNNIDPVAAGMISGTYDLYWFDQAQENEEWRNYKKNKFNLEIGKGYLYANTNTETLEFAGTIYAGNGEVTLSKESGVTFEGWNLVGNPFTQNAYPNKSFYIMNELGSEIVASEGNMVTPMQGIFVVAENDDDKVTFFKEPSSGNNKGGLALNVSQTVNTRGESHSNLVDRAIVRFGDNDMLPKFQLNDNSTKVYIPMNGKDYAVVSSEGQGELPVYFKAAENGTYTISVEAMNLDMRYLHLIDHVTGANVDLLTTPSYSFEARDTDMVARFKLVFSGSNSGTDENFAFISDGQLIINGNGTINVYDALGRIIVSTTAMQGVSTNNMTPGLYVLQLVNGNEVKTQKIIVK